MIRNVKAIYEQGVLRLKELLPLPDGTEVDVAVTSHEAVDERSQAMDDQSWYALTKLLAEPAFLTSPGNMITTFMTFQKGHDRNNDEAR